MFRAPTRAEKFLLPPLLAIFMVVWPFNPSNPLGFLGRALAQVTEAARSRLTVVDNTREIVTTGVYASKLPVSTWMQIEPLRYREMVSERGDSAHLVYFWAKNNCGFGVLVDVRKPELRQVIMYQRDSTKRNVELLQSIPLDLDKAYLIRLEDEGHTTLALKVSGPRQATCFGENHSH